MHWKISGGIFDQNSLEEKLKVLEAKSIEENFWDDNQKAQKILKEKNTIEKIVTEFKNQNQIYNDLKEFIVSLEKEFDEELYSELKKSLKKTNLKKISKSLWFFGNIFDSK